jgi:hypothetical protein
MFMTRLTRSIAAAVGLIGASLLIAVGAGAVAASSTGKADSGVVYFAITHSAAGKEYAAGNDSDKLFGTGAVTYVVKISSATSGTFKITINPTTSYYSNGTLTGTATAKLTLGAGGAATIANGKLTEAAGTGAQKGHSLTATFNGTGNATTGLYKVVYKGTYK